MNFALSFVIASIAAVALGLAVQWMLRDAAARHAVLLAALLLPPLLLLAAVAGLRLPAPSVVTPGVTIGMQPATAIAATRDSSLSALLGWLWAAGAAIAVARIVLQARRWRGVAARAEAVTNPLVLYRYDGDATLARSSEVSEPAVIGIVDPVIVLPAAYDLEPAELDAVFAHELAHVARRDNLTALIVQLVCAAFWFDPLHRVARRKLIELRERVCDALVLDRGCDAEAYVSALARSCEPSFHNPAVACMSRLNLEERMQSIMTHETRPRWPASITRTAIAVAVIAAAIGFATFAPAPVLIAGDVNAGSYDFDVRAIPQYDGGYTLNVRIDTPDGAFSSVAVVKSVPDTRTISTTHEGKTHQVVVSLASDGTATGTLNVTEGNRVLATRTRSFERQMIPPPPPPPPGRPGKPDPAQPRVIHKTWPRYPEAAKQAGIAGLVIVKVSIDKTGGVTDARVVQGLGHGLDEAAVDALRQWKFEPVTRDGKPVATTFNMTINFRTD